MDRDKILENIKQQTWQMIVIWTLMTLFMVSMMTITIIAALK